MIAESVANTNVYHKFSALKQERFSGKLLIKDSLGHEWVFYLFLGRILYATGGMQPVRRWRRNLTFFCPQIELNQLKMSSASNISWEYQLLYSGVEQQQISREQVAKIIGAIAAEVLFDVIQAGEVTIDVKQENLSVPQLVLLDPEQVLAEVQQVGQNWQKANIIHLFPNRAPVIKQPEQLQQQVSPAVYQNLAKLLDGQRSLRDLAVVMKRNAPEVISSLLPYIQSGLVELIEIADLAAPAAPASPASPATPPPSAAQAPLVACVDDSPLVCQSLEKILTTAGYQFLAVQDSLRAIATLLTRKPDLIFLDLVMPNTNGYEICGQLRKVSSFRNTPIIILTGNDGIIDRVRAKMVGASDFLSKPINAETVLEVARQHLTQSSPMQ
ncbi:MAG: response regulator [Gloeocapsa sp. UFS-A4-WI-NPMV-4B04]|jgi:chemotaxis family two-component system response regulator PixG|nr:response regulator [Gloeocapsa sp. UFS-A4-WI-NPMV-4B04]